jgi:hypothetical protein
MSTVLPPVLEQHTNTQSIVERFFTAFHSGDVRGIRDAVT